MRPYVCETNFFQQCCLKMCCSTAPLRYILPNYGHNVLPNNENGTRGDAGSVTPLLRLRRRGIRFLFSKPPSFFPPYAPRDGRYESKIRMIFVSNMFVILHKSILSLKMAECIFHFIFRKKGPLFYRFPYSCMISWI